MSDPFRNIALENQMEITELQEQLREARNLASRQANFIEALGVTLLDEEDYVEAERMLREALGRDPKKEDAE